MEIITSGATARTAGILVNMGIYNQGLTTRLKHLPFPHFMYNIFCLSASLCLSVSASVSLSVCVSLPLCVSIRLKCLPLPHFIYNNLCLSASVCPSVSVSLLCLSLCLYLSVSVSLSLNVPSTYPSAKLTLRQPSTKTKTNWNQHIWMEPSADEAFGPDTLQDVDNKSLLASQSVSTPHESTGYAHTRQSQTISTSHESTGYVHFR